MAIYTGCQNNFTVQHQAHFFAILKAPADKLRPHSQISFKSWLNNVGLETSFFLLKSMIWWLEKVSFHLTLKAFLTI